MRYVLPMICLAAVTAVCGCSRDGGAPVAKDNKSIQAGGLYATQARRS